MRMFFRIVAASLLVWLASCNDSVPTSPTKPLLPAPQSYVVSGTVSETANGISGPVAGRKVDLYISGSPCVYGQSIPCISEKAEVVETDQNGRYRLQVTVFPKTLVFVAGAGLHAAGQQPCLASALVEQDTVIDVQVFPTLGSSPAPASAGPMITGLVYETTPQGRNPLRGVWAWLQVGFADSWPVARIQTDEAGRFFFCRVNAPVQMVVSGYREMAVSGYPGGAISIPGTVDMFFEVELRR